VDASLILQDWPGDGLGLLEAAARFDADGHCRAVFGWAPLRPVFAMWAIGQLELVGRPGVYRPPAGWSDPWSGPLQSIARELRGRVTFGLPACLTFMIGGTCFFGAVFRRPQPFLPPPAPALVDVAMAGETHLALAWARVLQDYAWARLLQQHASPPPDPPPPAAQKAPSGGISPPMAASDWLPLEFERNPRRLDENPGDYVDRMWGRLKAAPAEVQNVSRKRVWNVYNEWLKLRSSGV
jgi:hypothetical protein